MKKLTKSVSAKNYKFLFHSNQENVANEVKNSKEQACEASKEVKKETEKGLACAGTKVQLKNSKKECGVAQKECKNAAKSKKEKAPKVRDEFNDFIEHKIPELAAKTQDERIKDPETGLFYEIRSVKKKALKRPQFEIHYYENEGDRVAVAKKEVKLGRRSVLVKNFSRYEPAKFRIKGDGVKAEYKRPPGSLSGRVDENSNISDAKFFSKESSRMKRGKREKYPFKKGLFGKKENVKCVNEILTTLLPGMTV